MLAGAVLALKLIYAPMGPDSDSIREDVLGCISLVQQSGSSENVLIPRGVSVLYRLLEQAESRIRPREDPTERMWEDLIAEMGLGDWDLDNMFTMPQNLSQTQYSAQ